MNLTTNLKIRSVIVALVLVTVTPTFAGQIIYVDDNAAGINDGSSWHDAYNYLQDALAAAQSGDEIRVAQGIYKPDQGAGITPGDRNATFQLINGVTIKGGFAGFGRPDPDVRDVELYESILSGDLNGDDDIVGMNDNSRCVVHVYEPVGFSTVLDGLTVTAGFATASGLGGSTGGSGLTIAGNPTITIVNCTFTGNYAIGYGESSVDGAAICAYYASPVISNCTFRDNHVESKERIANGAGIWCYRGSPVVTDCEFIQNTAIGNYPSGAGIWTYEGSTTVSNCTFRENHVEGFFAQGAGLMNLLGDIVVTDCDFIENTAVSHNSEGAGLWNNFGDAVVTGCKFIKNSADYGGALFNAKGSSTITYCIFTDNSADRGGGIWNYEGNPTVRNCLFADNSSERGGALWNYEGAPNIVNCTITSNTATQIGGGIWNWEGNPTIVNTIMWLNIDQDGTAEQSQIYNYSGSPLISHSWIAKDPLFLDPENGDYHLNHNSPCINAGDPNYMAEPNETDLDGRPRIIGGRIDIGAYEAHYPPVIYVDDDATGANNGSSWADAYNFLQDALADANSSTVPVEIRVAQGIYKPDQGTGITPGDREATFQLINDVILKGGYAGAGTPDPDARNITAYKTVLSGDLAENDVVLADPADLLEEPTLADNSYKVVAGSGTDPNALLDGFTVTAGKGGGGAGLYNYAGSPTLTNCTFIANAGDLGGAMRNSRSNPVLINCIFVGNAASHGGAMYNWRSSPTLTNCTFTDNFAGYKGGAINNSAYGNPTVTNCILYNNSDKTGMGESAQILNTYYASPVVNYSCIQGWTGNMGGTGNIGDNPSFLDPDGADNVIGTEDDNLRLLPGSPCIDTGDNSAIPVWLETDLDGDPRIANGIVDMGAYEGPTEGFLLSTQSLTVQEGRTATFTVALTMDPLGTVEVTVAPQSGDADISVLYGASLTFDSSNYSYPQTVTLTAAEDQDYLNSKTLIWISAPELFTAGLTATEWDNDAPKLIYVDWTASGADNGLNWTDAFPDLKEALAVAAGIPQIDEIRVAQGVYTPKQAIPGDRRATFRLINDLTIKGGYAGLAEPVPDDHNIELYETILSGDLEGNDRVVNDLHDLLDDPCRAENSYHVVIGSETDATAVLDGLTISAGNADYYSKHYCKGAGMYNDRGRPTLTNCTFSRNSALTGGGIYNNSSPTLTNCTFTSNLGGDGGGMFNEDSSPTLKNCTFIENIAVEEEGSFGGGMYNANSNPVLTNCTFTRNFADVLIPDHGGGEGGGMYNEESSPALTNCKFSGNTALCGGGGMANGYESSPMLINCIFTGNSAAGSWGRWGEGGGMYNNYRNNPILINCTFSANSAITGGAFYNRYNCNPILTNCILWGDTPEEIIGSSAVNYSDVQGGWPGQGNIDADPCFAKPGYWIPGEPYPYWVDGDYHLLPGSPCIDTGDPNYIAGPNDTDLDGKPRVLDGNNDGITVIDMGAYEHRYTIPAEARIVPRTINLASEGRWITCYIWPPEDYDVADIDTNTILLEDEIKAESVQVNEVQQVAIARFSREQVQAIFSVGDAELTVTGRFTDGTAFEAKDVIKVTNKAGKDK